MRGTIGGEREYYDENFFLVLFFSCCCLSYAHIFAKIKYYYELTPRKMELPPKAPKVVFSVL